MKKAFFYFLIGFLVFAFFGLKPAWAKPKKLLPSPQSTPSPSQEATVSAKQATPSAIVKKPVEKKENITESTPEIKGKLEKYLAGHPLKSLTIANFLQHLVRRAIKKGVPANTIVLILLFPFIAAIIAGLRHIVGIRGFGIFLPAVLSVVFVSTGTSAGLTLFLVIIITATLARMFLRKIKLQYLARMALLLWFVSLGVLGVLLAASEGQISTLMSLSIFPILILILLAENFISIHIGMSMKKAISMTVETLAVAVFCSFLLQMDFLQKFALLYPEITIAGVVVLDIFLGKYTGLRWMEYKKFKEILK